MRKIEAQVSPAVPLPGILTMSVNLLPAAPPVDGRQSATALAIARGTTRYLHALGHCVVSDCRCRPAAAPIRWRSAVTAKF
jgi:hypothetical protein